MKTAPAVIRHEREKHAAKRAALVRPPVRLDQKQLKLVLSAHDALTRKSTALMAEGDKVVTSTPLGSTTDHGYAVAIRRLDQLDKQREAFDARSQALRAHPQVRAAILAREKQEERKQ
jgi:hypothetical protein